MSTKQKSGKSARKSKKTKASQRPQNNTGPATDRRPSGEFGADRAHEGGFRRDGADSDRFGADAALASSGTEAAGQGRKKARK